MKWGIGCLARASAHLGGSTRELLTDEVPVAAIDGRVRFHARVAANVLAVVERQLTHGPVQERRSEAGLQRPGVTSAHELGRAIAAGAFDDRAAELHRLLATSVRDKLTVADPRHLALATHG